MSYIPSGARYVDDLVLRDRDADGNSGTGDLGKSSSGLEERLYALTDALYNVVALINTSGSVQERFLYDPYGKSKVLTPGFADRASSSYDWEYRFTCRRLDLDTGLQLNRNRYYHNTLGRWINRDPIGYQGSKWNLYEYVENNPETYQDPTGMVCVKCKCRKAGMFVTKWTKSKNCRKGHIACCKRACDKLNFVHTARDYRYYDDPHNWDACGAKPTNFGSNQCCSRSKCRQGCEDAEATQAAACVAGCAFVGTGYGACLAACLSEVYAMNIGCRLWCRRCKNP